MPDFVAGLNPGAPHSLRFEFPSSGSYLQEQLPPVHPEKDQPIAEQHGCALYQRLEAHAKEIKEIRSQVDAECCRNEILQEMRDAVSGDGIHSDHDQRERPLAMTLDIDHPTEPGQEQEAQPAAEQRPTRGPDALHYRTDVGVMEQQPGRNTDHASHQQAPHGDSRRGGAQPPARD